MFLKNKINQIMNKEIKTNNRIKDWDLIVSSWQKNKNNSLINSKTSNSKYKMQIIIITMTTDNINNSLIINKNSSIFKRLTSLKILYD